MAQRTDGLVATVGKIDASPNAGNVIAGRSCLALDVQAPARCSRDGAVNELLEAAQAIAERRGSCHAIALSRWTSRRSDGRTADGVPRRSDEAAGFPAKPMPSGAGHDAMVMAARMPTAMLFLRSPGGISHHPAETVREEDVEAALDVGATFLCVSPLRLDRIGNTRDARFSGTRSTFASSGSNTKQPESRTTCCKRRTLSSARRCPAQRAWSSSCTLRRDWARGFTQMTAEFAAGGMLGPAPAQRFIYVIEGELELKAESKDAHRLLPAALLICRRARRTQVRAARARRALRSSKDPIEPCQGRPATQRLSSAMKLTIAPVPLMGDDALRVRSLMPDGAGYDFAVNTMTYDPGAALSMVEIHVMEHGLLMLEGGGIYKLGDSWYPVEAGDFIWMAPYCPQWFGALGKQPAKYLIYKDWRRHPLENAG